MTKPIRSVFEYLDYRVFLADYYAQCKRDEYGFSYRVLARRAGCRSTNYPCLVIGGKRRLSRDAAMRFAAACGLAGSEAEYFCNLVSFNQAQTQREKEHWFESLARFTKFRHVHKLSHAQAVYFSAWYVPATRELAARKDFQADPAWIAGVLVPAISVRQARKALKTLKALGFLSKDDEGNLVRSEGLLSSGGPLGHHLVTYHREMLERAGEAIDLIPRDEREISALTLCVSEARLHQLKKQIQDFRKHLLQTAEAGDAPERVVQLNFQLFPLSKKAQ